MDEVETRGQQVINLSTCSLLTFFFALEELSAAGSLCVQPLVCSAAIVGFPSPAGVLEVQHQHLPKAPTIYTTLAGHKNSPGSGL